MSYEIQVYFAGEPFPRNEYEDFVQRSLAIRGNAHLAEQQQLARRSDRFRRQLHRMIEPSA